MLRVIDYNKNSQKLKQEYNGNIDNPPYYDPYNIHVHNYTKGYIETLQKSNEQEIKTVKNNDDIITYCKICHEIKPDSRPISNTTITSIHSIDTKNIKKQDNPRDNLIDLFFY